MGNLFPAKVVSFLNRSFGRDGGSVRPPVAPPGFAEAPMALRAVPRARVGEPGDVDPSDAGMLEQLLGLATRDAEPGALAASVVARFGSYPAALAAPTHELLAIRGFAKHATSAMKLFHEAGLRHSREAVADLPMLDEWPRVIAYLTAVLARERVEQFRILFLDASGRLLTDEAQARGTVNHTPVYPREVACRALIVGAASLILVHNHPSGDPTPSGPDVEMTGQVCAALSQFGIRVLDHVIIGNGRWTSFREAGLLPSDPN